MYRTEVELSGKIQNINGNRVSNTERQRDRDVGYRRSTKPGVVNRKATEKRNQLQKANEVLREEKLFYFYHI